MKFVLVNDDGIFAPGMDALLDSVRGKADTTVIAPAQEQSGMSQAITVHHPLRLTEVERGFMLDGTPADCIKMAIQGLNLQPDFILSGINLGSNLGTDVLYSGTVGAALEGTLYGIPSLAFSLCGSREFLPVASQVVKMLLFENPGFLKDRSLLPHEGILNINIPACSLEEIKGIRVTRMGIKKYDGIMERREDPRGRTYYWMGGFPSSLQVDDLDIDLVAVKQGYISITPLHFDLTFRDELEKLRGVISN